MGGGGGKVAWKSGDGSAPWQAVTDPHRAAVVMMKRSVFMAYIVWLALRSISSIAETIFELIS